MKQLKKRSDFGFQSASIHNRRGPGGLQYLKDRSALVIAMFSMLAFVMGNMMGQHGFYAFWASVIGNDDDALIVYTGTVTPIDKVVDYSCWAEYGGDFKVHQFRQAPQQCLKSLPAYVTSENRDELYSMQYMSSYSEQTEGTGHHAGVDIRIPVGTPIRAVMTAKVERTGDQPNGFGKFIVLKHPNVPDPADPDHKTLTLYSTYGHLSSVHVAPGDVVQKGQTLGLSGNTGFSTGPHLDFRLVRDGAPFYPYDPSSQRDGYLYTVSPMLYVQSHYQPVPVGTSVIAAERSYDEEVVAPSEVVVPRRVGQASSQPVVAVPDRQTSSESTKSIIARLQARREARLRDRLAERDIRMDQVVTLQTGLMQSSSSRQAVLPAAPEPEPIVSAERNYNEGGTQRAMSVRFIHDGSFTGRGWEKMRVELLDKDGETVAHPQLDRDLVLQTAYGKAEFRPTTLSALDFSSGEATVYVLPRGRQTVVVKLLPFSVLSPPMRYER